MKVIIVGGVAGGASAAARIRRLDETADIVMFERSAYISYANCGLPYYIGGTIENKQDLTLQTPESFEDRFNVQVKVRHEVQAIHPDRKTVTVKNLETGEVFEESYDKLLLAPGARPIKPPFEGLDSPRVFTLRTVEDTFKLKEFLDEHKPASAVVAGGGFIGLETAENLRHLGLDVTLVEGAPQLMAPFDEDMAAYIHGQVRSSGIHLRLNTLVDGFEDKDDGILVKLKESDSVMADLVVLAIGVAPDTGLAKEAGLALGIKNSIVVNDRMQTSDPDIYAVGDAVQIPHFVSGADSLISLAGPANKQARVAAGNMCGQDVHYKGAQGSSVIKVFDVTAAATGINERTARSLGLDTEYVIVPGMSHAGYYPGGRMMVMKVLFEKGTYRLLGAQIVGYDGVDKRIDVLATAIRGGMRAYDLAQLDLAYAPPYSSAKDPVNMAGFVIENIRDGLMKQWTVQDVLPENAIRLDTRTPEEYAGGHGAGFVNVPVDELRAHVDELEPGRPVYVMCQSGLRSYVAARILAAHGFDVYNFTGGFGYYDVQVRESLLNKKAMPCGMVVR